MKYRVKKTPSNRWVVQVKLYWFLPWVNVPQPNFDGFSYFEFKENAEEYKRMLESGE